MQRYTIPKVLATFLIISVTGLVSCKKENSSIDETIPYEHLNGKIAFSRSNGKIVIIDADLKTIKTVDTKDNAGIWEASVSLSSDKEKIAYAAFYYNYAGGYQVFTMSANGGNFFQISDPSSGNSSGHNFCPVWNSDATKLFYINGAANSGKIYSILPDGTNNTKITDFEAYGKISVSKDGNRLALSYSKGEFDNPGSISILDTKKDSLFQVVHNDSTLSAYSPVFSPDEKKIAFVQRHGPNEAGSTPYFYRILTVNIDGSDEKKIKDLPFEGYIDDTYLTWSPDGTKILFNYGSGLNGDYWSHIFIINSDGTGMVQITNHSDYDGAPSWVN